MINFNKAMEVSEEIEQVAAEIEKVIKEEINPGLELLGKARYQIESGNTVKAYDFLKEAANKFDLGFDDDASCIHGLADEALGCSYDHEEDLQPGHAVGQ